MKNSTMISYEILPGENPVIAVELSFTLKVCNHKEFIIRKMYILVLASAMNWLQDIRLKVGLVLPFSLILYIDKSMHI